MIAVPRADAEIVPRRSAHVQYRKIGGDTLLVDLVLKQYHVLNDVAGRIWDLVDGERSADDISRTIATEFDAAGAMAIEDVASTLRTLADLRLIETEAPRNE